MASLKTCCASFGVFLFNLFLIICTLPAALLAKASVLSSKCKPLHDRSLRRRAVFVMACLGWRLALVLSCWVRINVQGLREFRRSLRNANRPVIVVANHTSFLDTIVLVTCFPLGAVWKVRMFISSHLMKMPVLGSINIAMGHLAVPFKASADSDSFELDKELMAERMKQYEDYVRKGGFAGWYPEGRINPGDSLELQQFRAGGFSVAVNIDVEVWTVAFLGNGVCWPKSSPVGGFPGRIGIRIERLCESSLKEFCRDANGGAIGSRDASIKIANEAQRRIQSSLNSMADEGYISGFSKKSSEAEPLLKAEK